MFTCCEARLTPGGPEDLSLLPPPFLFIPPYPHTIPCFPWWPFSPAITRSPQCFLSVTAVTGALWAGSFASGLPFKKSVSCEARRWKLIWINNKASHPFLDVPKLHYNRYFHLSRVVFRHFCMGRGRRNSPFSVKTSLTHECNYRVSERIHLLIDWFLLASSVKGSAWFLQLHDSPEPHYDC